MTKTGAQVHAIPVVTKSACFFQDAARLEAQSMARPNEPQPSKKLVNKLLEFLCFDPDK